MANRRPESPCRDRPARRFHREPGAAAGGSTAARRGRALLKASGSTWWLADRVEYERNLAAIRAALSEAAFAAAWAEGQAMTQERAIAYASKQV